MGQEIRYELDELASLVGQQQKQVRNFALKPGM